MPQAGGYGGRRSRLAALHPLPQGNWKAASIHTYDDHRVAMCFSLAAFNADQVPVRIEDPKCVAKTFPDYFEALFSVSHAPQDIPVICIDGPTASGKGTLAALVAQALGLVVQVSVMHLAIFLVTFLVVAALAVVNATMSIEALIYATTWKFR